MTNFVEQLTPALERRQRLTDPQASAVTGSDAYGSLAALLRRAEADGHHPEHLLKTAATRRSLDDVDDPAAVLHHRVQLAHARAQITMPRQPGRTRYVAGLIPEATGPMTDQHREALKQRHKMIEDRASALVDDALEQRLPWIRAFGNPPTDPARRQAWYRAARTIAAYRDRHHITTDTPLGDQQSPQPSRHDTERVRAVLESIRAEPADPAPSSSQHPVSTRSRPGVRGPTL